jgi:hypothetical protein
LLAVRAGLLKQNFKYETKSKIQMLMEKIAQNRCYGLGALSALNLILKKCINITERQP